MEIVCYTGFCVMDRYIDCWYCLVVYYWFYHMSYRYMKQIIGGLIGGGIVCIIWTILIYLGILPLP